MIQCDRKCNIPKVSIVKSCEVSTKPNILADNELADLRWNRDIKQPRPTSSNSSYRRVGCIGDGSCFFHALCKAISNLYQSSYIKYAVITEDELLKYEKAVDNKITFNSHLFLTPRIKGGKYEIYKRDEFNNMLTQFRYLYVRKIRDELADKIDSDEDMHLIIQESLPGSIEMRTETIRNFCEDKQINVGSDKLQSLAFTDLLSILSSGLRSQTAITTDYVPILSRFLDLDIYLLRDKHLTSNINNPLYGGSHLHSNIKDRESVVIISVNDIHYELVTRVDRIQNECLLNSLFQPDEPLIQTLKTYTK